MAFSSCAFEKSPGLERSPWLLDDLMIVVKHHDGSWNIAMHPLIQ
jgi:hypothetical protein